MLNHLFIANKDGLLVPAIINYPRNCKSILPSDSMCQTPCHDHNHFTQPIYAVRYSLYPLSALATDATIVLTKI